MERFRQYLKGDISLWGVVLLFVFLSFLPVYSSSSNLVYMEKAKISTFGYLLRHTALVSVVVLLRHYNKRGKCKSMDRFFWCIFSAVGHGDGGSPDVCSLLLGRSVWY